MGGKARSGKRIAAELQRWRQPGQHFVDMFCGALNVTRHMPGPRRAVDGCEPLIVMWKALQTGWQPPYITEEDYYTIKAVRDPKDPRTALALFGCSYGGVFARSYAKPRPSQDYPACARNQALAKIRDCSDVDFVHADYADVTGLSGKLVYADPPWECVGGKYPYVSAFDSRHFWQHALTWGPCVFVSEGAKASPGAGWSLYSEWSVDGTVGTRTTGKRSKQIERLYVPTDSPMVASPR